MHLLSIRVASCTVRHAQLPVVLHVSMSHTALSQRATLGFGELLVNHVGHVRCGALWLIIILLCNYKQRRHRSSDEVDCAMLGALSFWGAVTV